jgi:hypothetical protein
LDLRVDVMQGGNAKRQQRHVIPVKEPDDPGRILLHASLYVWKQARRYSLNAWLEAVEILRRARNDYEDEELIEFGNRLEEAELAPDGRVQSGDGLTESSLELVPRSPDREPPKRVTADVASFATVVDSPLRASG